MQTILEYLCPDGKINHVRADEMCLAVKNYAKVEYDLGDIQSRAIYRFAVLTINYLDKHCNREDFNFTSFFKLLYSEIRDKNFQEEKKEDVKTVYDVLIGDAMDDELIYIMGNYWLEVCGEMPANADDMYHYAIGKFCDENDIEYDEDAMYNAREYHEKKEQEEEEEASTDTTFDVGMLLQFFEAFAEYRKTGDLKYHSEAEDAIESFVANTDAEGAIYDHCVQLLNEYKAYNPVLVAVKKNYVPRF